MCYCARIVYHEVVYILINTHVHVRIYKCVCVYMRVFMCRYMSPYRCTFSYLKYASLPFPFLSTALLSLRSSHAVTPWLLRHSVRVLREELGFSWRHLSRISSKDELLRSCEWNFVTQFKCRYPLLLSLFDLCPAGICLEGVCVITSEHHHEQIDASRESI